MARHFLTVAEVARELNKSERTIRRWIAMSLIPSVKIGGSRFVPAEVIALPAPDLE